ncbi:MAG: DUF1906 domain-containing protein, partial [Anaerolineales bacterium]|nr:DUF1906 domain-containing protein [Anaerolineales bacterium]
LLMLDNEHGWLATKRGTSSNFSIGTLFYTEDSGQTWERRPLPSGDPIYFIDQLHGWLVGSPSQDTLYHTDDGGQTWETQSLEVEPEENIQYLYLPTFNETGSGQLHAMLLHKDTSRLARYTTSNYGKTWARTAQYDLGSDWGDSIPLAQIDDQEWLYVRPDTHELNSSALNLGDFNASTRTPEGFQQIIMLNVSEGWAKQTVTTCDSATCQQSTNLWRTEDGGQTWTQFNTPISYQQVINLSPDSAPTTQQVTTMVGQGFDKCEIPTLSQLQNWYSNSPYRAINLYIGGSSRACGNGALSASYLQQLSQQGWKFIPTWVGPQAACSGYGSRMSNDPATAYNQGKAEANQAITVASNLGLTNGGTIIYYDLEGYPNDAACRNAAKSFISGWTYQLAQAGHKAGAYGSACASYVSDWATGSSVPEAIWPAAWYASSYDANASVWNVPCIDNGYWVNNQRIRQYAGGHNEAWGGVTLNIDSNAIRSSVATISTGGGGNPTEVILEDPTQLQYPYNNGCAGSGWERYVNDRGHYAYLTLNTNQPSQSTNWAEWRTTLPTTGQWRVYAYIPDHPIIYWSCLNNKQINWDTIDARYTIHHANGSETVSRNQAPLNKQWLDLGAYNFSSSQQARIRLTDLNGQPNLSETISVSALRFVYQPAEPTPTPPPPPPTPTPPPPQNAKTLNVRYVDQVYAQENSAGGYWILCGPSSAAMLLHYEGKESRDVFTNRQATRDLCGM